MLTTLTGVYLLAMAVCQITLMLILRWFIDFNYDIFILCCFYNLLFSTHITVWLQITRFNCKLSTGQSVQGINTLLKITLLKYARRKIQQNRNVINNKLNFFLEVCFIFSPNLAGIPILLIHVSLSLVYHHIIKY